MVVTMAILGISGTITGWDDPRFLLGIPVSGVVALIAWAIMRKVRPRRPITKTLRDWAGALLGITYYFTVLFLVVQWQMETGLPNVLVFLAMLAAVVAPFALFFGVRQLVRRWRG